MKHIVEKFVAELELQLLEKKVEIELSPEAMLWLAEHGYDELNGARPLGRLIQEKIKRVLADEILFGKLEHGGLVKIDVKGEELQFTYEAIDKDSSGLKHKSNPEEENVLS